VCLGGCLWKSSPRIEGSPGAAQHRALPGRRFRPLARRVLRGVILERPPRLSRRSAVFDAPAALGGRGGRLSARQGRAPRRVFSRLSPARQHAALGVLHRGYLPGSHDDVQRPRRDRRSRLRVSNKVRADAVAHPLPVPHVRGPDATIGLAPWGRARESERRALLSRFSDLTFRRAPPPPGPSHLEPLVSQAHADALVRAFVSWKYPRQIIVKGEYIVSVKVDDRGFIVHKCDEKNRGSETGVPRREGTTAASTSSRLEFNQRPGERKNPSPTSCSSTRRRAATSRSSSRACERSSWARRAPRAAAEAPPPPPPSPADSRISTPRRRGVRSGNPRDARTRIAPTRAPRREVPRQGMNTFDQAIRGRPTRG
jgi:hypothetical protein